MPLCALTLLWPLNECVTALLLWYLSHCLPFIGGRLHKSQRVAGTPIRHWYLQLEGVEVMDVVCLACLVHPVGPRILVAQKLAHDNLLMTHVQFPLVGNWMIQAQTAPIPQACHCCANPRSCTARVTTHAISDRRGKAGVLKKR